MEDTDARQQLIAQGQQLQDLISRIQTQEQTITELRNAGPHNRQAVHEVAKLARSSNFKPYDGKPNPFALNEWSDIVVQQCIFWNLDRSMWASTAAATGLLKGRANKWAHEYLKNNFTNPRECPWEIFKAAMYRKFVTIVVDLQVQQAFDNLKQTGMVRTYCQSFRDFVALLYPDRGEKDDFINKKFIRGLKDDVRKWVYNMSEGKTLDELITSAEFNSNEMLIGPPDNFALGPSSGGDPMDIDKLEFGSNASEFLYSVTCNKCGGIGHYSSVCPSQKKSEKKSKPKARGEKRRHRGKKGKSHKNSNSKSSKNDKVQH